MPVYRNTRTGSEFYSPCECSGTDIVTVPEAPAAETKPAPAKKTGRKAPAAKKE